MKRYIRSQSYNMIHLCIDEYSDYKIGGRAYNNTVNSPLVFHDINHMILKIDEVFDRNGNPLSSRKKRSFQNEHQQGIYQNKPEVLCDYETFFDVKGKVATFDIVVISRRQSSWQGIVFFEKKQESFSDVLELIKKITHLMNM